MKKLVMLVLAIAMCLTTMSAMAMNLTAFDAIDGVEKSGTTYTLTKSITLTDEVVVDGNITLNIGQYDISHSGTAYLFVMTSGDTMTVNGTGTIRSDGGQIFRVFNNSKITINKGVNVSATGTDGFCIQLRSNSTADVYGNLNAVGQFATISGNGNPGNGGTTVNIYEGASVTHSNGLAIFNPQEGTVNVYGGQIRGKTGIEMRAGNLNVSGGEIIATGDYSASPNSNGSSVTGAAVAVSQHTTNHPINVKISGGTLVAQKSTGKAFVEVDVEDEVDIDEVKVSITDGEFVGNVESENKSGFISGGFFTEQPAEKYVSAEVPVTKDGNGWLIGVVPVVNWDAPETGDAENMMMWVALMAMACAGLVATRKMSRE